MFKQYIGKLVADRRDRIRGHIAPRQELLQDLAHVRQTQAQLQLELEVSSKFGADHHA